MRTSFTPLVFAAFALATAFSPASGAEIVETFKDWSLYVHQDKDGKLCYIASLPKKKEGNYSKRGDAAAFVSRLPTRPPKEEVSIQPGYAYKTGSDVEVTFDDAAKFSLFTQGEHAWARTPKDDESLIAAMRRGQTMMVKGTSSRDTGSLDTYSLGGFTAAYNAMRDACKNATTTSDASGSSRS